MKAVSKIVVFLGLSVIGSGVASASTPEQTYMDTCRKDPGVPVPVSVVTPTVSADYTGSTVLVEFIVDQAGKPADLSVKSAPDGSVASSVMDAVKQWRFKPAERNGAPVSTKVVLPVRIVTPEPAVFATN